ncbi:unnamed protein product [Arabidopsis thaliana]|uniref:non-specific serine/threonine protein kinase n=1 Tax=Arabidopsis thaliana TaxID=3702 RepID=A0A5S9XU96_ARATH|nr:unnamed protein product [Arabidopsis thaliana]
MEGIHKLIFLALIWIFLITNIADAQDQQGFLSLDCGMPRNESSYTEESTGLNFSSDAYFISSGKSGTIKTEAEHPVYGVGYIKPYKQLRYFPEGTRNCYNLTVVQGTHYLIRAVFLYGNYDDLNQIPRFDLYLGPNFWTTINWQDPFGGERIWLEDGMIEELIHMPKSNTLNICLVKTGTTIPFISALELRPLRDDTYTTTTGSLKLIVRRYFWNHDSFHSPESIVRYPNDVHDRLWDVYFEGGDWTEINTTTLVNTTINAFDLPQAIFSKASIPQVASDTWRTTWSMQNPDDDVHVYLHFAEIQALKPSDSREFSILWNENTIISDNYRPLEFMADTVPIRTSTKCGDGCSLELIRGKSSTLPPSCNAMEVFGVFQLLQSETDENDVTTMKNIQATYRIQKTNWQGDPCVPVQYRWTGLNCSNMLPSIPPRITSLDFSNFGLNGTITSDIQYLNQLQKLDLSNNNLTGKVPEFLGKMKLLTFINLSGNNLSGSIPQSLLNMEKNGLTLLYNGNNLCVDPSCESETGPGNNKKKLLVPILASAASVGIITAVLLIIFLLRKKKPSKASRSSMVGNKRIFTYKEVAVITNNFERTLGEGAFGVVYHGNLNDNEQVAVKVLSESSSQGYKQFKAEVDLLLRVHHINLVTLVGYCDEGKHLVLIYEYMSNGNLKQHLSGECTSSPLSWVTRLKIAAETAQGLEYLHIGCKPPMIHRDIKSMNILLDNNLQAKLGDFGLSRSFPVGSETHVSTYVGGTPGYLDPDFGVVLLEIITSQPVNGDYDSSSLRKALELAMSCVSPSSSGRPNMSRVANELQECLLSETSSIHKLIFLAVIGIFFITNIANAQDQQGFVSLDCGMPRNESSYTDESTGLNFSSDADFINSGKSGTIKTEYSGFGVEYIKPYKQLRYFPEGTRNCYNLTVMQGTYYLIRAVFIYGNYDDREQKAKFDLHLGPNFWTTINFQDVFGSGSHITLQDGAIEEIIHMPKSNSLDICLVKTGPTTPFISALELRPLRDDTYTTTTGSLKLIFRRYFTEQGSLGLPESIVRYPYDVHDRLWDAYYDFQDEWTYINTTTPVNTTVSAFDLPQAIISKASMPTNASEPWSRNWFMQNLDDDVHVYLHFAEIQALKPSDTREFSILWNKNTMINDYYSPLEFMADTVPIRTSSKCDRGFCSVDLTRTKSSTLPPYCNAMEVFGLLQLLQTETDENDVTTMKNIQATYRLQKTNWQGDPCVPVQYRWTGLNCSNMLPSIPPRITSLDFSNFGLNGTITSDIQYLNQLQKLDLSNNNLTGKIPEFLGKMKLLTVINLSGNNLSGSIPQSLLNMQNNGLTLLYNGNKNLCLDPSCESETGPGKNKKKLLVPILASAASVGIIIAVLLLIIILLLRKKKPSKASMVGNKRSFTYEEVAVITNNFERTLGEGAFGVVYHGNLNDNEQVAVKVLSESSAQGYKQFKAEVDLLLRVHHINLVTLVGYCDEGQHLVLIYEYMSNGNLKQHLSGECTSSPLSWENRLRIAAETAQGLEYLHIGCKPPMIHRDIKSMNILLDNNFQAKLGDFGLSRSFPVGSETHVSTNVAGSPGYLDPEYYRTNWLTEKSDVFSFGVVLLEIITSKPVIDQTREKSHIGEWVGFKLTKGDIKNIVDPSMNGDYDSSSLWKALELAMSCVNPTSSGRPNMSQVANELQECLLTENSRKGGRHDVDSKSSLEQSTSFGPEHIPDAR